MDSKPLRIYSPEDLPRLRYIAGVILGDILGLPWEIVTDRRKLGKHPVINYSGFDIPGSFRICPDAIISETGVTSRNISVTEWKGLPLFFQTGPPSDFPFDIFASSFFLISRYEEYFDHEHDSMGCYQATSSLAYKNGFLGRPVVDLWAREFARALLRKFQTLTFRRNDFTTLLTFDVDQPFAYLGKNFLSSIGGMIHDLTSSSGDPAVRYRTVIRGEKDPFEVFDYISETVSAYKTDVIFFFPVGDQSKFDRNPSWKNEVYRNLIKKLACRFKTGLHPSYNASDDSELIGSEKKRLEAVTGKEIFMSRFHSSRLFMSRSYSEIARAGISEDYSMGYPEEPGFRAGIARPYYFYDLERDQSTNLKIFPFQLMDSTLFNIKKYDQVRSKEAIINLISETKRAGGTFVSIWHNTSLPENPLGQEWREVFEFMLKNQAQ